jgi:hypothetical protein
VRVVVVINFSVVISSVVVNSSVEGVCFVVSLVDIIGDNAVVVEVVVGGVVVEVVVGVVVVGGVVVEVVVGRIVVGVGQITFDAQSHTLYLSFQ